MRTHILRAFTVTFVLVFLLSGCGKMVTTDPEKFEPSSAATTMNSEEQVQGEEAIRPNTESSTEAVQTESVSQVTLDKHEPQEAGATDSLTLTVGDKHFTVILYDNETAAAFRELLPLKVEMSELNGNEKYFYLPSSVPTQSEEAGSIKAGELMIYGSDCLVLFYESFSTSYSYTKLGYVEDITGLADALGNNSVEITLE